jgi:hypothetical protein
VRNDFDTVGDAFFLFLNRGDDFPILVEDDVDDLADGGFIDCEAGRIDGFGWKRLPFGL